MRSTLKLLIVALMGAIACAASAATKTLKVSVTSVAGQSVFIDQGRIAEVVPGLRVRFYPPSAAPVEGTVADVSSTSARVELLRGSAVPPAGTTGELEVPAAPQPATAPTQPATRPTTVPAHPPWERQEGARTPEMPLLAPAFSKPPSERASTFHGRVYTNLQYSADQGGGRDNGYFLNQTGTSLTLTNPFGQGGEFRFDGENDYRNANVDNGSNDSQNNFIVTRLSYAIGTEEYSPYRLEMGRFISYYLPEIGWVDGVEAALRCQNGLNIGGGFGGYPRPFADQDTGQDLGFHVFADYSAKDSSQLAATVGYQRTWHDGYPDRDLLIGHASAWLSKTFWVYGSATADVYTASDNLKSNGPQLTDAWLQARYTPDEMQGASFTYSHYTWADIQGRDFPQVIPDSIIHTGRVDRVELALWRDIATNLRPTARANYFNDDVGAGAGGEFDLDWTNIGGHPLSLHNAVFYADGDYNNDWGFRTQVSLNRGSFDVYLGYEFLQFEFPDTQTDSGTSIRHTVRGGVGWQFGNWYYNLTADYYFGDSEDAYALGTFVEYRF